MQSKIISFVLVLFLMHGECQNKSPRPHIIFILADDLGWNDISFHGSTEIPTPNIDALAIGGLILNRYYSLPICTPSRTAFLTGKYPVSLGMQHGVLKIGEPRGLPLTEKLLPEYLSSLGGYSCHLVGKWHLGFHSAGYLPTNRGFKSHLGYWNGVHDYLDHTVVGEIGKDNHRVWGLDMRRNLEVAYDLHGKHSIDIFTNESISVIEKHNKSTPLFLFLSQIAPHIGSDYNPLPSLYDISADKLNHIKDDDRRRYAELIIKLDDGIGRIIESLKNNEMLNNSIIVFASDNGGPVKGYKGKSTSTNWPLKGSKRTLWEGGVRLVAAVWSRNLPNGISDNLFHSTDWIPTLLSAAGLKNNQISKLDGVDQWEMMKNSSTQSPRNEMLLNYDTVDGHAAIISGKWKLILGSRFGGKFDKTFGPNRYNPDNRIIIQNALISPTAEAIGLKFSLKNLIKAEQKLKNVIITCPPVLNLAECDLSKSSCLFDIVNDPCEQNNIAQKYPKILNDLTSKLESYKKNATPATNMDIPRCVDPAYSNYIWSTSNDNGQCNSLSITPYVKRK